MSEFPPFHPEWLITFWLTTPVLRSIEPHLVLVVIIGVIVFLYMKKRKSLRENKIDTTENMFQHLLNKRRVIEQQIVMLEKQKKQGDISIELYEKSIDEYKEHLEHVKNELIKFT
ncbi:hypothetical protein ACFYKX_22550 [Cytobacillus sp. FJAT-54145]|uniref:Uncharacterized protein n=1 Tax=Cytobacillus spartinae TaxID=3299023 RepID=A0ABW6KGF9_9BACI